jgi:mono/diheme cytochrome c family protein
MKRAAVLLSLAVVLVLAFLSLGLVAFAYSGAVNVAASEDYLPGAKWFFDTVSTNSIKAHAEASVQRGEISEPAQVTDAMLRKGASEYQAMCVPCHGTPGGSRGEFGKGMKPEPPDLAHTAREMELREVFWVVHHGIRHTGMPGFGATHSQDDLWAIATFVERFDDMSPSDFEQWIREAGGESGAHSHK